MYVLHKFDFFFYIFAHCMDTYGTNVHAPKPAVYTLVHCEMLHSIVMYQSVYAYIFTIMQSTRDSMANQGS